MSIGQRIKSAREQKNMTLEEVAKKCDTTKQTIFKYENEIVTNIPYEKILLLSKALDVSPSHLFGWEENNSPTERKLDEGTQRLIAAIIELSPEKQKALADLIGVDY